MDRKIVELEGKTIDEAIEKACEEFGVPREKLNIEIVNEGSSGFLGIIGSKKASIRASIMSLDLATETALDDEQKAPPEQPQAQAETGEDDGESAAARAQEVLEGVLQRMGLDFPVQIKETHETITLRIEGDGSGLLIGKGGQTLDALQYIITKATNKNGKERKRIILDTEDYRMRREKTLIALAEKLGQKAKRTKKPVTVNPMNAHDRRIVHLALQDDKQLMTKSRGDGNYRKIIILPTKKN
ncbi:MAG: protein jag [Deltaproteobacteria bacterium]|nr:protein jag [Deltaproteobacteria bacterium]MBN2686817.1 protein jag [Deltaproteobacteria bacterium]